MAEQSSEGTGTSKKSAAKKSSTSRTSSKQSSTKPSARRRAPSAEPARKPTGARVAGEAARQFAELSSKEVEGVTSLQRTEDGWVVELDVLELRRVPETTDVLAIYEVTLDSSGGMEGYRRVHRYVRGQVEDA